MTKKKDTFFDDLDEGMEKQAEQDMKDRNAESWEPKEEGDILKGIFLKVDFVDTKYGVSPLAVIRDIDTGESTKVWCSRSALRGQMEEAAPAPGTSIGIRYGGFVETPDGNYDGYHMYTVRIPERSEEDARKGFAYWHQQREDVNPLREQAEYESDQEQLKPF